MPNVSIDLGPDLDTDLRTHRPYFLVLVDASQATQRDLVFGRILNWVAPPAPNAAKDPITDIYFLSHGWHRNFFTAIEAYDRIVSRVGVLLYRARLRRPDPYNPLFITFHWHSDPGQNGFVDAAGRRNKASFLANVEAVFDRPTVANDPPPCFTDVFEDIYELFSRISAPDTDAFSNQVFAMESKALAQMLNGYDLKDAWNAKPEDKVAAVWTCFTQAQPRQLLVDQDMQPHRYLNPIQAILAVVRFLIAVVGATALIGFVLRIPAGPVLDFLRRVVHLPVIAFVWGLLGKFWEWLMSYGVVNRLIEWLSAIWDPHAPLLVRAGILLVVSIIVLGAAVLFRTLFARNRSSSRLPYIPVIAWLPLQLTLILPLLAFLLITFVLGGIIAWIFGLFGVRSPMLFNERAAIMSDPMVSGLRAARMKMSALVERIPPILRYPRYILSAIARAPITAIRAAVPKNSRVLTVVAALDNQLAFWEMQIKGVSAGRAAGEFIARLFADPRMNPLTNSRMHFLGHSFGGLVVSNAVRNLARDAQLRTLLNTHSAQGADKKVHSLCLLQAAMACDWFDGEEVLRQFVDGAIACVYSVYDTANGFYYPLSNNARMAAGFVGLTHVGDRKQADGNPISLGKNGEFASLVTPPVLATPVHRPWVMNMEGSRLVYLGNAAMGGGHGDIFKDDIVHLAWAATQI